MTNGEQERVYFIGGKILFHIIIITIQVVRMTSEIRKKEN